MNQTKGSIIYLDLFRDIPGGFSYIRYLANSCNKHKIKLKQVHGKEIQQKNYSRIKIM